MNDDLDTIRRVLAADVESFRRLVERYQRPLLTLIRNLTPPDTDHEGVAQEVFLAAFRSLASFDPKRSAFSTWLFTIARNRCRNELARRRPVVGAELPDNTTYQRRFMRRGDEVVFRVSSEPGMNWAKRVIALPGDTVEVKDKEVFVNGRQLPRSRRRGRASGPRRKWSRGNYSRKPTPAAAIGFSSPPTRSRYWTTPRRRCRTACVSCWATTGTIRATAARSASWRLATCSATYSTGTGQPRRGPGSAS